ncbi:MAG: HDOD domain-containing protein [Treponema sp.]|nr:HDOD domain-containing protein [Treponema sp.]
MEADFEKKLRDYIKTMPSLPTSVTKVLEICNNPNTSPADLNQVISLDPVLVGRVLKLINSAYYGLGQPVTSLARAIIMLGINTVKNLALSTAVMGHLPSKNKSPGLDMEGFWRHSLCVGVSAKLLARKRGVDPKLTEEYFTAGLLHDIGKIPLNAVLSNEYMRTVSSGDKERKSLFRAEESILGLNHCSAGDMIRAAWKLDGAVGDAIVHHHDFDEYSGGHKDVLYSTVTANWFVSLSGIGFSGDLHPEKPRPHVWEALGVSLEDFDEIEKIANAEIEKAEIFLKINN